MRISDWSSDVCSSDLAADPVSLREYWTLRHAHRPDAAALQRLIDAPGLAPDKRERWQQRLDWLRTNGKLSERALRATRDRRRTKQAGCANGYSTIDPRADRAQCNEHTQADQHHAHRMIDVVRVAKQSAAQPIVRQQQGPAREPPEGCPRQPYGEQPPQRRPKRAGGDTG